MTSKNDLVAWVRHGVLSVAFATFLMVFAWMPPRVTAVEAYYIRIAAAAFLTAAFLFDRHVWNWVADRYDSCGYGGRLAMWEVGLCTVGLFGWLVVHPPVPRVAKAAVVVSTGHRGATSPAEQPPDPLVFLEAPTGKATRHQQPPERPHSRTVADPLTVTISPGVMRGLMYAPSVVMEPVPAGDDLQFVVTGARPLPPRIVGILR